MWDFAAKKADRLDRLLRDQGFPGAEWLSRQAWDWLLENGRIEVNGRKQTKAGAEVESGSRIQVSLPSERLGLLPADQEAPLEWEGGGLAVFAKPVGVPTLPLLPWDSSTFASQVAAAVSRRGWMSSEEFALLADPPSLEGGLLQRLDGDTSGLVCVALNTNTKALFRRLFSESQLEKTYYAQVSGDTKAISGTHRLWLSTEGTKVKAYGAKPKGKAEEVELKVETECVSGHHALVKVTTRQGARHIVRAGMAHFGCPLVGDRTYGGEERSPHHQLHAQGLRLLDKKTFPAFPSMLACAPPESFLDSLHALGLHWKG
ncbi:MAG TPA: pseudouridine synthase [Bdellovibrionota bacterium]|jgi:23S rRNA pseudouridine1911/1915/1917 synthase